MTEPTPFEDIDLTEVTQTRRIPVWKHRAKGWRTRALDHVTASLMNGATFPSDSVACDTIDVLTCFPLMFLTRVCRPVFGNVMFRRPSLFPTSVEHLDLSRVVLRQKDFHGFSTPGRAIRGDLCGVCMSSIRESIDPDNTDIPWYTAWSTCR